jgi:PAS domain S-box-containing protein
MDHGSLPHVGFLNKKMVQPVSEAGGAESSPRIANAAAPNAPRPRPIMFLVICGSLLVLAIAVGVAILVSKSRNRALADNQRELSNITLVLAEQTARAFQAVELVQISLIERMQVAGISSSEEYERRMSGHDVHLMLKDKISGLPHVDAVTMINAQGKLINFSRYWPIPAVNVADRDYFKALKSDSSLTSFVSEPVRNRGTGTWTIYIARKFAGPNGEFLGLVLGAMELQYFEKFFGSIALGPSSAIALFRRDGVLLARHPRVDPLIGRSYGTGALFIKLLANSDQGVGRQTGVIDNEDRLIAAHAVAGYPIAVTASATVAAALSDWRNEAQFIIGAGVLAVLVIGALIAVIARHLLQRQKRSQQVLSEQKLQLDTALNNMRQGLLMFDSEGRLVLHNQRYREMYGLPPEALKPGCTLSDLLRLRTAAGTFKGDPDQYIAKLVGAEGAFKGDPDRPIAKLVDDGQVETKITELPDGRSICITSQAMPGAGWVSTHEDITERQRVEKELARNKEFLDLIIENVPSTITVKDMRDFRYILINRAGEQYYQTSRDKIVGKTAREGLSKASADHIEKLDRQLLKALVPLVDEHTIETPGHGLRVGVSKAIPIFNGEGEPQYVLVVVEDVTERKATEQQLRQAQKMEAVGNLTGGLAHDFNNLLLIIIGNLDLLKEEIADNPSALEKVETTLQAGLRGADLTRQMLAFSRRQPLHPKRTDVNQLISNTTRLLTRTLGEDITVQLRIAARPWPVLVDDAQFEATLVNIAINARDAMPGGGTLIIETRNVHLDTAYAMHHPDVTAGDYVLIEISDTGTGMPPEVLDRVFEPFFTTKAPGQGTGLGLSMVYGFMKQSGGHVSAYSEIGKGTTFRLYLPRARVADAESEKLEGTIQGHGPLASGEVILAVDDNAEVRATVVKHLRGLGYRVLEAENGQAALDALDSSIKIDLLFTDMVMPGGINGKELASKARIKRPNLKVLFTSGFPGTLLSNGTELDVGNALLSKPYRKHDLAKAIRETLDLSSQSP